MSKSILITGATGFVGRQVLKCLQGHNHKIHIVSRIGKEYEVSYGNIEKIIHTSNMFLEDSNWWAKVCEDIDIVIHIAWYAEPGKYLQSSKNIDCLIGTLKMAKGCSKAGIKRFIGIGTCFEYDLKSGILFKDTPLLPHTPYAAAKSAAYMMLSQFFSQEDIEFVWCRLFYLYGEGEDIRRLAPYVHSQLAKGNIVKLTRGKQIRDFIDVEDAGKIIADVTLGDKQGVVNVCSGIPITVRQFVEKIADEYGRRDLLEFGAREDNIFDPPCVVGVK
jgi:dTDP-6-deoxy-L-talose 4-dehydrogenase (NAD+)